MLGWSLVVDLVRAGVFAMAHVCGNSVGSGILAVSVLVRLALLPVTLRVARRGLEHQRRLAALQPELARLWARHGNDPARLADATARLYRTHGIGPLPRGTVGAALVQIPIGAALYQAVSGVGPRLGFLWVADLARPDAALAALAALVAAAAMSLGDPSGNRGAVAISAIVTLFIAWRMTASVALYWVASGSVGAVQALALRRSAAAEV
jgi:YidC/Oxa1 family membrane protein insertase